MKITINHCNNIEHADIEIIELKLNIKYAINGTGKSTISKAIQLAVLEKNNLASLTPFKYRGTDKGVPKITGMESIKNV